MTDFPDDDPPIFTPAEVRYLAGTNAWLAKVGDLRAEAVYRTRYLTFRARIDAGQTPVRYALPDPDTLTPQQMNRTLLNAGGDFRYDPLPVTPEDVTSVELVRVARGVDEAGALRILHPAWTDADIDAHLTPPPEPELEPAPPPRAPAVSTPRYGGAYRRDDPDNPWREDVGKMTGRLHRIPPPQ